MANGEGFWYRVQEGDSLSRLAKRFGLKHWKEIYDHDENAEFRELRPNPNVIQVGDHVWIPARRANRGVAASGMLARFFGRTVDVLVVGTETLTHHGLLKENETDWTKNGQEIPAQQWTSNRTYPVSLQGPETLRLKVSVQVRCRQGTSIAGRLVGVGKVPWCCFEGPITLKPGTQQVSVTAGAEVPRQIGTFDVTSISWRVEIPGGGYVAGTSGPHKLFLTFDRPIEDGRPEDGATTRRMATAVHWYVNNTGKAVQVVDVIEEWFKKFPNYILSFDMLSQKKQKYLDKHPEVKTALTEAGFAAYMKEDKGGAWPLAEYTDYGGECQAIVRFIRGLKNQIGLPGTAEVRYVNADASDYMRPVIKDRGSSATGPDKSKRYVLVDREVKVGKTYTQADVGWNNYEAYMKFAFVNGEGASQVAWFGGGVGKIGEADANDPDEVAELERTLILVFWGLAEYEWVYADGGTRRKVTQVWEYPHPAE